MSCPLEARKGRDLQRYENKLRLVAGCIPYRLNGKLDNQSGCFINRVEVLMISSPGRADLIFPKGGWETDESAYEAACREALEEAGVRGIISETELGYWMFRSKSSESSCGSEGYCKGCMFVLEVTEELDCWPEQECKTRKWVSIPEAYELCRYEWMREALAKFKDRLLSHSQTFTRELSEPSSFSIVKSTVPVHALALC